MKLVNKRALKLLTCCCITVLFAREAHFFLPAEKVILRSLLAALVKNQEIAAHNHTFLKESLLQPAIEPLMLKFMSKHALSEKELQNINTFLAPYATSSHIARLCGAVNVYFLQ